ncbi:DUF4870 family protein [Sulfurimonas sp.]|uniref:DUF4870 family protein n=1 Tax=Sulfurimonas sp. TaxID=2022749 RepID=UPI0039E64D82
MSENQTSTTTAKIIYIVLMVGLLVPFIGIIALIVAYVNKGDGPLWLDENYRYQIRTFWIGVLYFALSYILTFIFIGFITFAITFVWYVIRCAKGLKALNIKKEPANVSSWLI